MTATSLPDPSLVDAVIRIARQAGDAIMAIYAGRDGWEADGAGVLVARKADASPLTQADLAAHRVIVAGLQAATPAIPVVSEEDPDSHARRRPPEEFWLIDPLDGTKEFLSRRDEFTVNIALVRDGRAVFGVVHAPALDQLYWGGVGLGACRATGGAAAVPIRVAAPAATLRVVASKSHLNDATRDFLAGLPRHDLIQAGSSLKFCRIAEGEADIYPRLGPTSEWDTAAAQAVVEAAGGLVVTLAGEPLRYGKDDILNPSFVAAARPLAAFAKRP